MSAHPPKPRFALSVGVVGHRPNRLPAPARTEINTRITEALALVEAAAEAARLRHGTGFSDQPPALHLVSALAEGADRMAAQAALERSFALSVVLPFTAEEYEKDFADASSRAEFRALLGKSAGALALRGDRAQAARAYEVAGLTVLDNADILLAVWDRGASAGRGGTTELIERAAREGMPIIHVDAAGEAPTRLLWSGLAEFPGSAVDLTNMVSAPVGEALSEVVDQLVRPPADAAEAEKLSRYLNEAWKPRNWRPEVPLLLTLLGVRKFRKTDWRPQGPDLLAAQFAAAERERQGALAQAAGAYGWADALGAYYAQIFRGAYVSNFVAAAMAVAMAAGSLIGAQIFGWPKWPFVAAEVVLIFLVIANTICGRRWDWHGRWLEAREVAERLRAGLPRWLLGQRPKAFSGGEPTWTGWYVRAHFRSLGLAAGVLDTDRLATVRDTIAGIVDHQCQYHEATAERMHKVEHRVERIGMALFLLTLGVAVLYLLSAAAGLPSPAWWTYTVTALTAGLPALAAATYGIRLIGDFEGTAKRSQRTAGILRTASDNLRQAPVSLNGLRSSAMVASDAMLGDVAHWRLASETRELAIPG